MVLTSTAGDDLVAMWAMLKERDGHLDFEGAQMDRWEQFVCLYRIKLVPVGMRSNPILKLDKMIAALFI